MFDSRDLRVDLAAIVLAVIVLFLCCAVFTHDPADPCNELPLPFSLFYQPDPAIYPANPVVNNAAGPLGATVADALLRGLGWGTYYLLGTLVIATIKLFVRRHIRGPVARMIGWLVSLAGLTALFSMLMPRLSLVTVMGAGGYMGELSRGVLQHHFAAIGGFMFALALLFVGVLLCTDYVLVHLLVILGAASADRVVTGTKRLARRPKGDRSKADAKTDEADAMSIRIGGRKVGAVVTDDLVDVEDEIKDFTDGEEEDDEYEDGEAEVEDDPLKYEADDRDEDAEEQHEEDVPKPMLMRTGKRRRLMSSRSGKTTVATSEVDRDEVMQQLDEASQTEEERDYELPSSELLIPAGTVSLDDQVKEVRRKAKVLEATFANFGFDVKVVDIETGPVIAQYEVELEAGLRLSKITGLADDLAIALRVPSVRIVAPIPGKNTVGNRSPKLGTTGCSIARGHGRDQRPHQENENSPVFGQGRVWKPTDRRSLHTAASADRGSHWNRKECVSECNHFFHSDDATSRRSPHVDDRSQNGRIERLQVTPPSHASGRYGHAQSGSDFGVGRGKNGGKVQPVGAGGRATH